jgi:putative hydrolase of the HAD superfamily
LVVAQMTAMAMGFDLGDTLCEYAGVPLNWEGEYAAALARVAEACGSEATPDRLQSGRDLLLRYNTRVTPRPDEREYTAEHIFGQLLAGWDLPRERLVGAVAAFFRHFRQTLRAFPESVGVLNKLHELGVQTGVLTDVPYGMPRALVVADLSQTHLPMADQRLLTSTEVGHRKPHPAGFRALAERLEVHCADLLYIGNERKDVDGGKAAGCRTVLLWRSTAEPPVWGQEFTIGSLEELLPLRHGLG